MTTTAVSSSPGTAVDAAASQIGDPYIWDSPLLASTKDPRGFDCSGLTMWSYNKVGVTLPHSAQGQYWTLKHRPVAQAQPGDLIFWGYGGSKYAIHHVAIYSGNGNVIEAPDFGLKGRERPIGNSEELIKMAGAFPGTTAVASSSSSASSTGTLATIIAFLRGKGLSDAQAAGVAGNWQVETGGTFSSSSYNANENAIGIVQWEGSRRTRLQAFAAARGTKETDLGTQLAFFWSELRGDKSTYAALTSSTDATQAATVIQSQYERSAAASLGQRQADARTIAAALSSGDLSSLQGITSGIDSTGGFTAGDGSGTGSATGGFNGIDWNPLNWGDDISSAVKAAIVFVTKLMFALAGAGLVLLGVNRAAKAAS